MKRLLGNEKLISQLNTAAREDRLAHAYLLCGKAGCGKRTLAQMLSQMILCDDGGCERCRTCDKIAKGIHPDVIYLRGETKSGAYSVDQIRHLRADALVYPNEAKKKVYILLEAEKMNPASQDAFLKILEEPPAFVVFILVCNDESKLLTTIHSRTIRLSPELPPKEQTLRWLSEQTDADMTLADIALGVAGGNPGRALELLREGEIAHRQQQCEEFCHTLLCGTPYDLSVFCHKLTADKKEYTEFINMLCMYLRDVFVYQNTRDEQMLIFRDSVIGNAVEYVRFRRDKMLSAIEKLQQLASLATQPISALLLGMRLATLSKEELI